MIIDCRLWWADPDRMARERVHVFIDGVEIKQVWYVDTEAGFVKTYDVLEDGAVHSSWDISKLRLDSSFTANWEMPLGGAASKTIHGSIELRPFDVPSATEQPRDENKRC